MTHWWLAQKRLWSAAWRIAQKRALYLSGWWFASGFVMAVGWLLWQVMIEQLHVIGLSEPAWPWRVGAMLVVMEYLMVSLQVALMPRYEGDWLLEDILPLASRLTLPSMGLRLLSVLCIAVSTLCLVVPGVLVWVFSSAIHVDLLASSLSNEPMVTRAVSWARHLFWRVISACAAWHLWSAMVLAGGVCLAKWHMDPRVTAAWLMVWVAHLIWLRCLQVAAIDRLSDALINAETLMAHPVPA